MQGGRFSFSSIDPAVDDEQGGRNLLVSEDGGVCGLFCFAPGLCESSVDQETGRCNLLVLDVRNRREGFVMGAESVLFVAGLCDSLRGRTRGLQPAGLQGEGREGCVRAQREVQPVYSWAA